MDKKIGLFWLRDDFRITKNNALIEATRLHDRVVVFYLYKEKSYKQQEAQKWWLSKSLSNFRKQLNSFNIKEYCSDKPFSNSCNALFHWAPIADELKELDKEIVINSIKNKWMLVVADFEKIPVNLK